MKKLLNTLYITTQGSYLHREGETVVVKVDDTERLRLPIHTINGIVCFGRVSMSPHLMGFCGEHQITVSFLLEYGEFWAGLRGVITGNILLRRQQHRLADQPDSSSRLAQTFIMAKIANCRSVLMRSQRDRTNPSDTLKASIDGLAAVLRRLLSQNEKIDSLRGIEGDAARLYFSAFDEMIIAQKSSFSFTGRNRRPPTDSVNALLSFLYTLLVHDVTGALEGVGLDPYAGFLHADRPGRPSLALDLMEELRPILADRLALTLINRQQVKPQGFIKTDTGAVLMDPDTKKEVIHAWQRRKQEEVLHPYLDESAPLGLFPHLQAMLLARFLRGDLDGYPALIWKS